MSMSSLTMASHWLLMPDNMLTSSLQGTSETTSLARSDLVNIPKSTFVLTRPLHVGDGRRLAVSEPIHSNISHSYPLHVL